MLGVGLDISISTAERRATLESRRRSVELHLKARIEGSGGGKAKTEHSVDLKKGFVDSS